MSIIETKELFNEKVAKVWEQTGVRKPKGFGISVSYHGQENVEKLLMAKFPVANWGTNFGSAAAIMLSFQENGVKVDTSKSEVVLDVTEGFSCSCMEMFNPFIQEMYDDETGELHKNVQVIEYLFHHYCNDEKFNGELYPILYEDYLDGYIPENVKYKVVFIFDDQVPVQSVEAATLQLYAISQGDVKPRELPLNGAFGIFENIAKGSDGVPYELAWLRKHKIKMELDRIYPKINMIDKFGTYLDYILPNVDNTRILDAYKVRIGAQLAAGTTVMPGASYINFNAGTLGSVMVEGRISSSAIVGAGSDVGGGASILGVLSGTDGNPITIGENTLLGANSTCGIPLGDGCIIDAGIAILEGTKVTISQVEAKKIQEVNSEFDFDAKEEKGVHQEAKFLKDSDFNYILKGKDLSSLNGTHFRQDSKSGKITASRSTREIKLNADLH